MFNLQSFFSNFKDRNKYDKLSIHLNNITDFSFSGKYVDFNNSRIPYYETNPKLDNFHLLLEECKWSREDIESVKLGVKIFKNHNIETDSEAFVLCIMLRDMFPEKTDLIDLIIEDLESGMKKDNRDKYKDLFDLDSEIMNMVLFYMS